MRILTETEFGVVVGGGPPPAPWDDPTGMRRPWQTPGHRDTFSGFGPDGGGEGGGGDKRKPAQETAEERREGEVQQLRDNAQTARDNCPNGVKTVSLTDFECQPPPSQSPSG